MEKKRALYLMISRTDSGMGRIIRQFTGYGYNHVSLSLDPTFRSWVSFARYYCDAPLYGGYIVEPAERYLADGGSASVRIFRIDITEDRMEQLERLFARAGSPDSGMIYNTFDALATTVGRSISIPNAYTCLGFACRVLERQFANIRALDSYLEPYLIYQGELGDIVQDSGARDDIYFTRLGLWLGAWATLKHFARLSVRAVRR